MPREKKSGVKMTKPRKSLAFAAILTTRRRKDAASLQTEFTGDGLELLDDSRTLTRKAEMSEFFSAPVYDLPRFASKYDIFTALLPPDFAKDVLVEKGSRQRRGPFF